MKTTNTKLMQFNQEMVSRNPGEILDLFQRYNISAPVNPENLAAAILKFGKPFKKELFRIYKAAKDKDPRALVLTNGISSLFGINKPELPVFTASGSGSGLGGVNKGFNSGIDVSIPTLEELKKKEKAKEEEKKEPFWERMDWNSFSNVTDSIANVYEQINISAGKNQPVLQTDQQIRDDQENQTRSAGVSIKSPIVKLLIVVVVLVALYFAFKHWGPKKVS